ncbi:hypothetical protein EVAR_57909_1 [Eumeta japonica]|uniref:Uncharacterized protein n=1 Tax=Eumeta variegata TaxID=151549 RepID=A0A4C1ZPC0_EUMVA|nr:hypothetical protein EVAR_57909_1 [Eumeta japonica]
MRFRRKALFDGAAAKYFSLEESEMDLVALAPWRRRLLATKRTGGTRAAAAGAASPLTFHLCSSPAGTLSSYAAESDDIVLFDFRV